MSLEIMGPSSAESIYYVFSRLLMAYNPSNLDNRFGTLPSFFFGPCQGGWRMALEMSRV
jgi:hypothetical protein